MWPRTLDQANDYLVDQFLPWWNQHLSVVPANPTDAHRPLGIEHDLASALSRVEMRQVGQDYTIRILGKLYQIARADVRPRLRGSNVRVELRLDGSLALRFQDRYLSVSECQPRPKSVFQNAAPRPQRAPRSGPSQTARQAMNKFARSRGLLQ